MLQLPPTRNAGCGLGTTAIAIASMLVGAALVATGMRTGGPLVRRGLRHSASGCGRRRNYALGHIFGVAVG